MRSTSKALILVTVLVVSVLAVYLYTTSTAPPEEAISVTLTTPSKAFGYLWAYAGVEAGIFAEEGIDLEILVTRPSPSGVQAVIEGSAQFTAIAESGATAMLRGANLKILASVQTNIHQYLISRPEIERVEDLKGGTLAVSRTQSMIGVVTREILELQGLNPDTDVEIVNVGSRSERFAAVQQGHIEAGIFAPPENILAEEAGLNVLLDSSDVLTRRLINVLMTSQRMIEEDPDTVKRMVKATVRSMKYVIEQSEEAIQISIDVFDIEESLAREVYNIYRGDWGYSVPIEDVQSLFEGVNGFLDEPVDFDVQTLIDYSFLNEALKELGEFQHIGPGNTDSS